MTIETKFQELETTLERLKSVITTKAELDNFENIKIPFQLTQISMELWKDCFSSDMLRNLSHQDPETIEAWIIGVNSNLRTFLAVLNQWWPLLDSTSIGPNLVQKTTERRKQLKTIEQQISVLVEASQSLFNQEQNLRNSATELSELKHKINELKTIEAHLKNYNIVELRAEVQEKEQKLIPQKQTLEELRMKKSALDQEINLIQQQQTNLTREIVSQQSQKKHKVSDVFPGIKQLVDLIENNTIELSSSLRESVQQLGQKQNEYNQEWDKLQKTREKLEEYTKELNDIQNIQKDLNIHYQSNRELCEHLPIDTSQLEPLLQAVRENLSQVDEVLQVAHRQQENIRQKQYITFRD